MTSLSSALPASTAESISARCWHRLALGQVGDHHRQGGPARAGRTPQEDGGKEPVGFDGAPQELARTGDVG